MHGNDAKVGHFNLLLQSKKKKKCINKRDVNTIGWSEPTCGSMVRSTTVFPVHQDLSSGARIILDLF